MGEVIEVMKNIAIIAISGTSGLAFAMMYKDMGLDPMKSTLMGCICATAAGMIIAWEWEKRK